MKTGGLIFTFLLSVLIITAFSCEEKTDWEFKPANLDFVVINGQITNEKKAHKVVINRPVEQLNQVAEPVSSAFVSIYDGDSLYILSEDAQNKGNYLTSSDFRAVINKQYTLLVIIGTNRYTSTVVMQPVVPFNQLKCRFNQEKQMFTIDSVTQPFDINESAMYEISVDWSQVSGYDDYSLSQKKALLYYYKLSTIDVSEVFKPQTEEIYFPKGTTIVEKKYSLTKEHAAFIRTLLLNTEWSGGLFDVTKGNTGTNLSNGAVGFFSASSVYQKSFVVE